MAEVTQRRLAAIVSADVVGFSRLMGADETGTLDSLRKHRTELIDPLIARHGGRIVKIMGDGLLLEFPSVVNATQCSVEIQQGMVTRNAEVPADKRITFRVGVNLGDIIIEGEDILGDGVNIAARLQEVCEPGGIAISRRVQEDVEVRLEATFVHAGEHELKNIARAVEVWRWSPAEQGAAPPARPTTATPPRDRPSIAVLPFDNMSGDSEQEFFADGITEDIITELSKFRWLTVIARNSTFVYKNKSADIPQVGRELGVGYVLEGSVRKAGERVRVTAQLIEAQGNEHIWAERYDRQLHDIFDLQDEMTQTIVGMIEPELANRERERARRKPTKNMSAWELYQRGLWHRWRFTPSDIAQAHKLFDEAIEHDAGFAAAYAHRAWTRYVEIMINIAEDRAATVAAGIADARRAVELNDRDPLSHCAYGFILTVGHDFAMAVQNFRRSLDLNPSFAAAQYGLGLSLAFSSTSHDEESIQAVETAARLSPNDPLMWTFLNLKGMVLYRTGAYAEAKEAFWRASQYANALHWVPLGLAASLWRLGDEEQAREVIRTARADYPNLSIRQVTGFLGPAAELIGPYIEDIRNAGLPEQ